MKINILSTIFIISILITTKINAAEHFIVNFKSAETITLYDDNTNPSILYSKNVDPGVLRAIYNLQSDFTKVTGECPLLTNRVSVANGSLIIIGTIGTNSEIDELVKRGKLDESELTGKREKYIICNIENPYPNVARAIVIAGSDKRGTIYGIYELSRQIGVSPWYYWADVPVEKRKSIYFLNGQYTDGEPAVKYRGIFLNDEAPALSGWSRVTFGGFNSKFYEKVFELLLRLKANYLWPAMWGSAFYDDDPASGPLANEMGIVMGTSHHEPMALAQSDWHRYVRKNNLSNVWDYKKNGKTLRNFWEFGLERAMNWEKVVTIGMRGDGDEAMSEETNISLLEKIVKDQRKIIEKVTREPAASTPQVWALYKEVQNYYDQGMRVPDDVVLLFCDDNWGNVRKLPDLSKPLHPGGYGMYYHFDYVGAPRNAKWININPVQKVWEQMNLTYEHGVDNLWIVNVGDLKPMEYPMSFFLDMAWNPKQFNAQNLLEHTEAWAAQQFGEKNSKEIARIINLYSKYNRRVTPEMLNHKTYSLDNYNEFETVVNEYRALALEAFRLKSQLSPVYHDAYFQLVLYPVNAVCNLYEMYYAQANNMKFAAINDLRANYYAQIVKDCFVRDSLLQHEYNNVISKGKWSHMMDQVRIGYSSWNEPKFNIMPEVAFVTESEASKAKVFKEQNGYVAIEAENFARSNTSGKIRWEIIPHFGKTKSAITTFPQNIYPDIDDEIYLEYDVEFETIGVKEIQLLLAPTLNFNDNKGLRYEISIDGAEKQIVNFNGHYKGELGLWQAEHIISSTTKHKVENIGVRRIRFRVLEPGIVLQRIIINSGGLKPSFLGPHQSDLKN